METVVKTQYVKPMVMVQFYAHVNRALFAQELGNVPEPVSKTLSDQGPNKVPYYFYQTPLLLNALL